MDSMRVDVWSDVACPWCYVGKRRLEAALARFPHASGVEIVYHSFELDPSAPKVHPESPSQAERLAQKYGMPVARALAMMHGLEETAKGDGLDLHLTTVRGGSTFDAHRLLHLALEQGPAVQGALKERLLAAFFTENVALGDEGVLAALAVEVGLDRGEVDATLASDRFAREVRRDEAQAQALSISGVPFFVVDGRYGVSGAQPADVLLSALEQAWATSELGDDEPSRDAPGGACSVDDRC